MAMESCVSNLVDLGVPRNEAEEVCRVAIEHLDKQKEGMIFNRADINEEERYVLGPVLIPYHVDSNDNIFPPSTIRNTAFNFMEKYQLNKLMHLIELEDGSISIVESYVVPTDNFVVNGKSYPKGTWMLGVKVHNDKLWEHIKKGDITGFSIGGRLVDGYLTIADVEEGGDE